MRSLEDYLEEMEDVLESSKPVAFSSRIQVEKARLYDIIDEIRLNLPDEMRQARRIIEDHDKVLNEGKAKSNQMIKEAENLARDMTSDHEIYKMAVEQASEMIDDAKRKSNEMHASANEYVDRILARTEEVIKEALSNIKEDHRVVEDFLIETGDIIYNNRLELRDPEEDLEIE